MQDLLRDRSVDTLEPRSEKIAVRHPGHGDQLTTLTIICFQSHGQVNAVIHLKSYFEREVPAQLLGNSETRLNGGGIVVVFRSINDAAVWLIRAERDAKSVYIFLAERNEWKFSEADPEAPQSIA